MNLLLLASASGLGKLQQNMVSNWIGPAFFIIVASFALKFIISRQFRELASFLGIASVVALLVFNADGLFGKAGLFTKIAQSLSDMLGGGGGSKGTGGAEGFITFLKNFKL